MMWRFLSFVFIVRHTAFVFIRFDIFADWCSENKVRGRKRMWRRNERESLPFRLEPTKCQRKITVAVHRRHGKHQTCKVQRISKRRAMQKPENLFPGMVREPRSDTGSQEWHRLSGGRFQEGQGMQWQVPSNGRMACFRYFFWGNAEVSLITRGQANVVLEFVRAGSPAKKS